MSTSPHLAAELIDLVLEQICQNHGQQMATSIRAVALISRAWVDPTQSLLFRRLSIQRPQDARNPAKQTEMISVPRLVYIAMRPHLAHKVRNLTIGGHTDFEERPVKVGGPYQTWPVPDVLPWLPAMFPQVEQLNIIDNCCTDIHNYLLSHIAPSWSYLTSISISMEGTRKQSHAQLRPSLSKFPLIRELVLRIEDSGVMLQILCLLASTPALSFLVSLELSSKSIQDQDTFVLSKCIQSFDIFPNISRAVLKVDFEEKDDFRKLISHELTLGRLPLLKSLHIGIPATQGTSVGFLRALLASSDLPALTHLKISFAVRSEASEISWYRNEPDHLTSYCPYRPFSKLDSGEIPKLEGIDDGSVLRPDILNGLVNLDVYFDCHPLDCFVWLYDVKDFFQLFGGVEDNSTLNIRGVSHVRIRRNILAGCPKTSLTARYLRQSSLV